jgi:hypothetical protein
VSFARRVCDLIMHTILVQIQTLQKFFSKLNILLILVRYHDMLASSLLSPNSYIENSLVNEAHLMLEKDHFRI